MWNIYIRTNLAKMRCVDSSDTLESLLDIGVSISQADIENGSPKIGDMIAVNPDNDKDMWLVEKNYFLKNFELKD